MPLFSIITITFNNKDGLRHTAKSVQSQTYQNYEWIIIDGASTDGTKDDFINYPTAKIISELDVGIYDAMNKGIGAASGDYIIFMNAGDCFADTDVLNKISTFCSEHPDFIYGDSHEGGHLKCARQHSKINWGMFTHHQAMFYSRKALGGLRYNLSYKIAADYDLTLRFLKVAKHIVYASFPICIFETGGVSQINAKLGRDEQFISRRENKSCGAVMNHTICAVQKFRFLVRKNLPGIYWQLLKT